MRGSLAIFGGASDAHLPETGQLKAAAQAAMPYMLAHGNDTIAG